MSEEFLQYPDDGRWRDKASCRNIGKPDLFFDTFNNNSKKDAQRLATIREMCASCTVNVDCLDFAVRNKINYGVWGGLTASERRQKIAQVSVTVSEGY